LGKTIWYSFPTSPLSATDDVSEAEIAVAGVKPNFSV